MKVTHIDHPEAVKAIVAAARLRHEHPDKVTQYLTLYKVNRQLFILASVLQAAETGPSIGKIVNETA